MAVDTSNTPFPLGAYLSNPDNSNSATEAIFEAKYTSFSQLMGTTPQFLDYYIDQTQSVSSWLSNSQYEAISAAASPDADTATPVIALPMSSTAGGMTPDQYYQAFASGKYDSMLTSIVKTWANEGFTTQYYRPGWEMNLLGASYAGSDAQTQADWVSAFQHIYTVLHQAGQADGVNVQVIWNPSITNYSNAEATTTLYPGNNYVDVIGADVYADAYPYNPLYDWDKNNGTVDSSLSQWLADPVNREHYWTYPAATPYSLDGSDGHNLSLIDLLQFAKAEGKPVAIAETGAGNSNSGTDVTDDAAFPQWLAATLQASGDQIAMVNIWDSDGGGNYEFTSASDGKPLEAAAWAKYFGATSTTVTTAVPTPTVTLVSTPTATPTPVLAAPPATVTVGSGTDTLVLSISEDAWQGDAQFTISVDGQQIGGTQSTTASHASGQVQLFDVLGTFASGSHTVSVNFLNDAYGGSSTMDRNLYVTGATIDGATVANSSLTLLSTGAQSVTFATSTPFAATTTIGSGTDTVALTISEEAWQGDAQFTVSVDGQQIGGTQTAAASNAAGQSQVFDVLGNFGIGGHLVTVNFLNDAYGGSSTMDRNLYVDNATIDGSAIANSGLTLLSTGPQSFSFVGSSTAAAPAVTTLGTGPDTLALAISEDAWEGNAQFTVSVDGQQIGGVQSASVAHGGGQSQTVDVMGNFSSGSHTVAVDFLNDLYSGSATMDRNLYVNSATIDGSAVSNSSLNLLAGGSQGFTFSDPVATAAKADTIDLHVSEDAWQGDAQFTVSIDGTQLGAVYTATASHGAGATQDLMLSGNWGTGSHTIGISFINDAYGGSASTDRNLYVDKVSYDGTAAPGGSATLLSNGTADFGVGTMAPTNLTLHLAEDAYQGDAQYSVTVDGVTLVQDGTATAVNSLGKSQSVTLQDALSAGKHDVAITFLNDLYGGSPTMDRNLYVTGIDVNATPSPGATAALLGGGTTHFSIMVPSS